MVWNTNLHDGFLEGPVRLFICVFFRKDPSLSRQVYGALSKAKVVLTETRDYDAKDVRKGQVSARVTPIGSRVHKTDPYRVKSPQE